MRIDSFCRVELRDLVATAPAEYIRLHYGSEGAVGSLIGLSWNYNTQDRGLHVLVKKTAAFGSMKMVGGFKTMKGSILF